RETRPTTPIIASSLLLFRTIRLPRSRHELELTALHELLEHAELGLLANVQDLIDRVVRLFQIRLRACVDLVDALELLADGTLVELRRIDQTTKLHDPPRALIERLPTDVLERFEAREELRELIVADLQLILRLHERVGVEHPLDFAWRHDRLALRRGARLRRLTLRQTYRLPVLAQRTRLRDRGGRRERHKGNPQPS